MPSASGGDIHVDRPLSNLVVTAFDQGVSGDVAGALFPQTPAGKQSDKYYIIEKGAFLRIPDTSRAPKTKAKRIEFTVSSDSYFCNNYALAAENSLEDLANADIAVQLRQNSTLLVVGGLVRDREVRIANLVTSISNVGSGVQLTGANKWSDNGSDPVSQVNTAHAFIRNATGLRANTAVVDYDSLVTLRTHPLLLDMYKYTAGGQITLGQLKEAFMVDRLLIGTGIKENALEGATSSVTNIWGNNFMLAHIGPSTGLQSRTLGLNFIWRNPVHPANMGVERSVEKGAGSRKVEIVEAGYHSDEKIVASELGYVIQDTL